MNAFLQVQDIGMTFPGKKGSFVALQNIHLEVKKGECIALIGHSGCGKSTLLNILSGLIKPTSGRITCAGQDVSGPSHERALVFQNHNLLPWLSCLQNVQLAVESVFGRSESVKKIEERSRDALHMVGLLHAADRYPHEISGGMKQRVGIARALAIEPSVLLLDEPFGALDALTRSALQDELAKLMQKIQATTILVTHDVDEAVFLADQIIMMTQGPSATIGKVLRADLERPRDRLQLAHSQKYQNIRAEVLEFLYCKVA